MLTGEQLGAAIDSAIKKKAVTKKALADFFEVKPPSIQDWIKRGTISKEKLPKLWAYFSDVVGPEHWGLSSYPAQVPNELLLIDEDEDVSEDYILIKESEVKFKGGNGQQPVFEEVISSVPIAYRRDFFIKNKRSAANCKRFKVSGWSMESTLFEADSVLVDLSDTSIIDGKVYAFRYGDELRIKRLYKKINGGLIIHSDNENFLPRDEELSPAEVDSYVSIVGRVIDKSGSGGL